MEGSNGVRNSSNVSYTNREMLHPPISPLICISPAASDDNYNVDTKHGHQRCSSESLVIEEQPAWLDDLLNEPDMHQVQKKMHRRSASDPSAYFDSSIDIFGTSKQFQNTALFNPWVSPQNVVHRGDARPASLNKVNATTNSGQHIRSSSEASLRNGSSSVRNGITLQVLGSTNHLMADQGTSMATGKSGQPESGEKSEHMQANNSASKAEAKCAKQQSAQRSRVRKLQYIAELERNVQLFQGEGQKLAAELEFLDQQNLILGMENRTLRQRLESISQEQLVRHMEHDVLEKELLRLQVLYQLQRQQLQQQHQNHQQHLKHRRSKSRDSANKSTKNKGAAGSNNVSLGDLESHLANISLRANEPVFSSGSLNTSVSM